MEPVLEAAAVDHDDLDPARTKLRKHRTVGHLQGENRPDARVHHVANHLLGISPGTGRDQHRHVPLQAHRVLQLENRGPDEMPLVLAVLRVEDPDAVRGRPGMVHPSRGIAE